MPSTMRAATAVAFSLSLSLLVQMPSIVDAAEAMDAMTYIGCFSSSKPMTNQGSYTYQTSGYCQEVCYNVSMPAMGLYDGADCYCGELLPAEADKVSDSNCNVTCNGYGTEDCGGDGYWSVYETGLESNVAYYGGSSSSSTSSSAASTSTGTATTASAVVTTTEAAGKTVVVTYTPTGGSTSDKKSGGTSTAGIAAGVVVGVVAAGAIAGGVFFYLRNRRRKQVEEEYSKRSQAQDYSASSAGISTRGMSVRSKNDARLDPSVSTRRLSDGSIADEQDYSRRILTVTNPDDGR